MGASTSPHASASGQSQHVYEYADRGEPLSTAVIEALAAVENVDPIALDVRLNEAIDPDILDALGRSMSTSSRPDSTWCYRFTIDAYAVELTRDGVITVDVLQ